MANSVENAGNTSKEISKAKAKAKTASTDMNTILEKREDDYEFIAKFLNNLESVVSEEQATIAMS